MSAVPRAPRSRPAPAATKPTEADSSSSDLALSAVAIFDGGRNNLTLKSGKEVVIRPATMGQLPQVMLFFGGVVSGLDASQLAQLVDSVVHAQKMAISRGEDPNNINLRELATDELVDKAFGHASLLSSLLAAVFHLLPGLIEAFTNVTEDEYRKLELDEGMLIAGGIFLLNYRFFTQSLLPILTAYMKSWASKKGAAVAPVQGTKTKATK